MLNDVHLGRVHYRLLVGAGHAQIKGGDQGAPHRVFPGYVNAGLQFVVIDGKACDFFHDSCPFYRVILKKFNLEKSLPHLPENRKKKKWDEVNLRTYG